MKVKPTYCENGRIRPSVSKVNNKQTQMCIHSPKEKVATTTKSSALSIQNRAEQSGVTMIRSHMTALCSTSHVIKKNRKSRRCSARRIYYSETQLTFVYNQIVNTLVRPHTLLYRLSCTFAVHKRRSRMI